MSDRICVIHRGRIVGEMSPPRHRRRAPRPADGRRRTRDDRRRRRRERDDGGAAPERRRPRRRPIAGCRRGGSRIVRTWRADRRSPTSCSIAVALAPVRARWSTVTGGSAIGGVRARCSTAACARPARGASRSTTAAPLLVVAVGTIVAGKAGLSNIGQEGQVLLGAAAAGVRRDPAGCARPGADHRRSLRRRAWSAGSGRCSPAVMKLHAQRARGDLDAAAVLHRHADHRFRAHQALAAGVAVSTDSRVNNGQPINTTPGLPSIRDLRQHDLVGRRHRDRAHRIDRSLVLGRTTTGFRLADARLQPADRPPRRRVGGRWSAARALVFRATAPASPAACG